MKRVRMLLRVSSNQQLEADGDLTIQRQIVKEYIEKHTDWNLDKEYFEGSNSGYKNSVANRDSLQEILQDAKNREYDILVVYKDDRLGRLMWEIGAYVMALKGYGVDIYTVKDGCISPENDDIMGQMMLALRYGNAQKSSADTGIRVKDTAQKLVKKGKFMGGAAPYGYELQLSGKVSKHGRALHHLVIVPERARVVRRIYDLSLHKEFGSAKIARILNEDDNDKHLAPNDIWKSGTITSILTNPIYAGYTAYKRRERVNGKYHRLDSESWILSSQPNKELIIIDCDIWNRTQEKRKKRSNKYIQKLEHKDGNRIRRNDGILPVMDVAYCGYCGCKMVNGSKYNYWTLKSTGEKKASKIAVYKCQNIHQDISHNKIKQFRADVIEPVIFEAIAKYIEKLQEGKDIWKEIEKKQNKEKKKKEEELKKERQEFEKISRKIEVMENRIPDAMTEQYPLSLKELTAIIKKYKEQAQNQMEMIRQKEQEWKDIVLSNHNGKNIHEKIPTWKEVFLHADTSTKRVLVNRLIERIDIKKDEIILRFKIGLDDFSM